MNQRLPLAALVVGIVTTLGALGLQAQTGQKPAGQPMPMVSWTGSYSAIDQRELLRITTAEDWKALWLRHQGERIEKDSYGEPVIPAVDFDRFMVIAILGGKAINTRSEAIIAIDEFTDHLRIRWDAMTYQTESGFTEVTVTPGEDPNAAMAKQLERAAQEARDSANNTTPYGIFVIPKTKEKVTLEENVQSLLGAPPIWEEQIQFEGLPG